MLEYLNNPVTKYAIVLLLGIAIASILTPLCTIAAIYLKAVDNPGGRRIHKSATPRGAGFSIYVAFHLCAGSIYYFTDIFSRAANTIPLTNKSWWISFLIASSILVLGGVIDDTISLKPYTKLFIQIIAITILFLGGTQFEGALGFHFPVLLNYAATLLWFIIIINAFNLIDGYDGLATGIAIIAALGIGGTLFYRHLITETLLLAGFIGACIGFLRFNIYPAKVFLGDTGSMFLGFVLAAITLKTTSKGTALAAIWIPILALGIPLFDTFLAIWRRLARKVLYSLDNNPLKTGIMSHDAEHIHHRLHESGITPRNITAILYLINSILVLIGLAALLLKDTSLAILFIIFLIISFFAIRFAAKREIKQSSEVVKQTYKKYFDK